MREKILTDLKNAMKAQDKETLSVLRMVKGAMQLEEINQKKELDDEAMIALIGKQIKTRKESIHEFQKGNRQDLVDATEREIHILETYMPEQLSDVEIDAILAEVFAEVKPVGPADMGKIMKVVSPKLKGKADMSLVSEKIKNKLAQM